MGVVADAVSQVMDIADVEIQDVPAFGARIKVDYLQGMAQLGKKFVLLLDIDRVLSADEAIDLNEATAQGQEEENAPSEALPMPEDVGSAPEAGAAQEGA